MTKPQDHDNPELRERVRANLLYPARDPETGELITYGLAAIDQAGQARAMAGQGFTLGDIATFQGVTVERVQRMLGRQQEQAA